MNIPKLKIGENLLTEDDKKWIADELESILNIKKDANADRYYEMLWSFVILKHIVKGESLKFEYARDTVDPYSPFDWGSDAGYIRINGKRFEIMDNRLFKTIGLLVNYMEICPKVDGTADMDFGFRGLQNKKGDK